MTLQSLVVGIGLFIVLTIVAYIIFPVLFQGQINALSDHLSDHASQSAHFAAGAEIKSLENRVIALEASVMRTDTLYRVPVSFMAPDSLK